MKQLHEQGVLNGSAPELTITVGPVWQTISRIVNEQHPGLLVLGTHGRSGIPKLVLGSVAERAFREAPCPVLTVGPCARSSILSGTVKPNTSLFPRTYRVRRPTLYDMGYRWQGLQAVT